MRRRSLLAAVLTGPVLLAAATLTASGAGSGGVAGLVGVARAATVAEGGDRTVLGEVLPDADGVGTFSFTAPAAVGATLTVELVAWDAPTPVGTVTGPVPTVVRAGGGPGRVPWPSAPAGVLLGASPVLLVAVASRRRRSRAAR